jgi:RND superfamily putative drug exporter
MILVPATMKLMGDANWWLPNWLDRLMPTIDMEGETSLPDVDIDVPQASDDREPVLV